MGLIENVANVVKNVVASVTETQAAVETAATTSAEQTASVFSATSAGSEVTNTSSTTVILSEDYNDKQTKTNYEEIWITGNNGESMEKISRIAYGYNTYESLSEGEKNSAATSIVDNNRWMIDNINETYLTAQVTQDVIESLYPDGLSDENMSDLENQVGKLLENPSAYSSQALQDGMVEANDVKLTAIADKILKTQNNQKDGYGQFDKNVNADQIPVELIHATDFSEHVGDEEVKTVYCPKLNTLNQKKNEQEEQLSETHKFSSEQKGLEITQDMLNDPQQIQNAIAKNYLGEDYEKYQDENGNYDLTSSLQGVNILDAISKEEGNNNTFAKTGQDAASHMEALTKSVEEFYANPENEGKTFTLYCPDTEINVLTSDGNMDTKDAVLTQGGAEKSKITYIHADKDSVTTTTTFDTTTGQDREIVQGYDILNAYQFGDTKLSDLANSKNPDDQALVLSALEQITSNNPNMKETAYNQYVAKLGLSEGKQAPSLESLTTEQKLDMFLNADYTQTVKDNGGEVILENIQYIVGNTEAKAFAQPRTINDTPATEVPDEPATPEIPDEPETPVIPDEPQIPEVPEEPEIPDEPEVPDEPETPVIPDEPEVPVVPDEPDEPETPVIPDEPEVPVVPDEPDEPETPCPDIPEVEKPDINIEIEEPEYKPPIEDIITPSPTIKPDCPTEEEQGDTKEEGKDVVDDNTGFEENIPQTPEEDSIEPPAQEEAPDAPCPTEPGQGDTNINNNNMSNVSGGFETTAPQNNNEQSVAENNVSEVETVTVEVEVVTPEPISAPDPAPAPEPTPAPAPEPVSAPAPEPVSAPAPETQTVTVEVEVEQEVPEEITE